MSLASTYLKYENDPKSAKRIVEEGLRSYPIPKKKTKERPLTDDEKEMNKLISSYRVLVEHAIGGMKRYLCLAEKLRNRKAYIDDTFILLSAGLWNYHLQRST